MTITKAKIAAMLSSKLGFSNNLCEEIVHTVLSNILEIAKEQKLTLKNFGSFEVKQKKSTSRNKFSYQSTGNYRIKKAFTFCPFF